MNPSELFSWYCVGYAATFVLGLTMLGIGMLGLGGDHDIGADGGVDHDADASHSVGHSMLDFLGFGRCPFSIVVMSFCFLYTLIGMGIVLTARVFYVPGAIMGAIAYPVAFITALLVTGVTARLINRLLPTRETSIESEAEHVGSTGTAVFDFDSDRIGFIQVRDKSGTIHELKAKDTGDKPIRAGDMVLVTDYDKEPDRVFQVQKAPDELSGRTD
jgi:membrane protein implicated in regulation of membrane protease activity